MNRFWKKLACECAGGAALLALAQAAPAQEIDLPENLRVVNVADPQEEKAGNNFQDRIERLERQNEELLRTLKALQGSIPTSPPITNSDAPNPTSVENNARSLEDALPAAREQVQKLVSEYLQGQEAHKKSEGGQKQADGFVVGKDLGLTARWNYGPWLESQDKAFKVHFGGRTQFDIVGYSVPDDVMFGTGGIGNVRDGVNFRRARLEVDGWFNEVIDFFAEYDFLNTFNVDPTVAASPSNVANVPVPTDLWVSINHIPWLGVFRAGNFKPPISFEHLTSSRYLNFMERSFGFDAFVEEGNNGFSQGLQILNWTKNERLTWQLAMNKVSRSIFGWNIGDGEWEFTGRVTALPYYQDEGRFMVHVGLGGQHQDLDDGITRFRARTEIRNGPAVLHNIAAISRMEGSSRDMVNPELFINWGPLSLQAEYQANWVHDVGLFTAPTVAKATPQGGGTYFSQAAYVEVMYFLTGEHRNYTKTGEHGSGAATSRQTTIHRPYFWVPGQNCGSILSCGAWQVGLRYSYLDLNNAGINGGQLNSVTAGLNWYLNPNFKIQWNYDFTHRDLPDSTSSGDIHGGGVRFAYDF